jgi:hypothetical protein
MASSGWKISEQLFWRNVKERKVRTIFLYTASEFTWNIWGKPRKSSVTVTFVPVEICRVKSGNTDQSTTVFIRTSTVQLAEHLNIDSFQCCDVCLPSCNIFRTESIDDKAFYNVRIWISWKIRISGTWGWNVAIGLPSPIVSIVAKLMFCLQYAIKLL